MTKNIKRVDIENEQAQVIRQYSTIEDLVNDTKKRIKIGEDLSGNFAYVVYYDGGEDSITLSGELI